MSDKNYINMKILGTYNHPDNSTYYPHWTNYIMLLTEDNYQVVEFNNHIICEGYELEVIMPLINEIQYWAYGKQFLSKGEMIKACNNKAFW